MLDEATRKPAPRRTVRKKRNKSWVDQYSRTWVRVFIVLFKPIFRYWIRYFRWYGVDNIPPTGGMFLICNHTTAMDPFLVGFSMRTRVFRGPGRIELFSHPVPAYIMRKIGMFPLRQRVADAAAVRTVYELIRAGHLVLVFPEGGRSTDGHLQPFVPGFVRLALRMNVPLLPMAIAGGTRLMPMGSFIPKRNSPVVAVYGKPFDLTQFEGRELTPEVIEEAAALMHDRVGALLADAQERRQAIAREHGIKD